MASEEEKAGLRQREKQRTPISPVPVPAPMPAEDQLARPWPRLYPSGAVTVTISWFRAHRPLECFYCGCGLTPSELLQPGDTLRTWDHVIPVSAGGGNEPRNKVPSCESCNRAKGAKSLEDFRVTRSSWKFYAEQEFRRFRAHATRLKKPAWQIK